MKKRGKKPESAFGATFTSPPAPLLFLSPPPSWGRVRERGSPGPLRTDTPSTNAHTPANLVHRNTSRASPSHARLLCCCGGAQTHARGRPPSAAELAARLQARYDETRAFHADFVQEVNSAALGRTLTSRGHVYFEKPGRMRWEFRGTATNADRRRRLVLAVPARGETGHQDAVPQRFNSQTPISFLTGVGRLEEDFAVSPQGETERVHRLRLLPNGMRRRSATWDVEVDKATFDILQATVIDPLGNTNAAALQQRRARR